MARIDVETRVPGNPDEVLRTFAEFMGSDTQLRLNQPAPGLLFLDRTYRPWLLLVPVILLFPVGLLLLLVKQSERVVVSAHPAHEGTDLTVQGKLYGRATIILYEIVQLLLAEDAETESDAGSDLERDFDQAMPEPGP